MALSLKEKLSEDEFVGQEKVYINGKTIPSQSLMDELVSLYGKGDLSMVVSKGSALASDYPCSVVLWNILGAAYLGLKDWDAAEGAFSKAVKANPDCPDSYNNLGILCRFQGRMDEALQNFRHAVSLKPDYLQAQFNLGNVLRDRGELEASIEAFQEAIRINPEYAEGYNNLGNVYETLEEFSCARSVYERAVSIRKEDAVGYFNLANACKGEGDFDSAIKNYEISISKNPNLTDAYYNLGNLLQKSKRIMSAIRRYQWALSLRPTDDKILGALLFQEAHVCNWSGIKKYGGLVEGLGIDGETFPVFCMFRLDDSPERQLTRSRKYTLKEHSREAEALPGAPEVIPRKLRIGYFSADFHEHATMFLMSGLFGCHDRRRFEIFIYSYGSGHPSAMRERLIGQVEKFSDVHGLSDTEIVGMAREDGLHIAIDLKGYTEDARTGLFADRLAPVQINYLGYPGTMGADFIDYIVADKTVIPEDCRAHYMEEVIYLPHSYQPNDDKRVITDVPLLRADFGLPEDGFVFCCFNNNYKITPAEFDVWSRLLARFEGSVLWLLRSNEWSEENLCQEMSSRGVDASRLVFADAVPHADHLARHGLADLFLDTFNCNAHTTASDALWAGLPIVTKMGRQFAARVAASLLRAVGLPELVVETTEEYETLAAALVENRGRLTALREKLAVNRLTFPLFDTVSYTRNLENAYEQAYQLYFEGKKPETIYVSDKSSKVQSK